MKFLKLLPAALALAVATGCSTVNVLNPNSAEGQKASSFESAPDRAVVYVYRDRASHFGAFALNLKVNGDNVSTSPACYKRIEFQPGTVTLEATHPDMFGSQQEITVPLIVGDVKVYEFRPIARFGLPGESKLLEVSTAAGKALVANQHLCVLETLVY